MANSSDEEGNNTYGIIDSCLLHIPTLVVIFRTYKTDRIATLLATRE